MTNPLASKPWVVVEYEVKMYLTTHTIVLNQGLFAQLPRDLKNAVTESAVLHTRILCDVFLSRAVGVDDIQLSRLFPNWDTDSKYSVIKSMIDKLRLLYGSARAIGSP